MKKLIFIICSLILFSCEDFMHENDFSIGQINNYEELVTATNGVYGELAEAFNASRGSGFYNPNIKGDDLSNEDAFYPHSYSALIFDCDPRQKIWDSYYEQKADNWIYLYSTIVSANNIISQFDLSDQRDKKTKELLGEVYLIRAYCYFRLTRVYGEIPLVSDINIDYTKKKNSFLAIYTFIEKDLNTAIGILPDNNSSARINFVTPHRGVAKALLAELYLNWAGYPLLDETKYSLSASIAEEVIDSSAFFGFSLLNDFAFLWDKAHYYNSESVFTLYFANPLYSSERSEINYVFRAEISDLPALDSNYYAYYLKDIHFFFHATERKFYDYYPNNYRKEITFYTKQYFDWGYYGTVDYFKSNICTNIAYRKFFLDPSVVTNPQSMVYHQYLGISKAYLFRYAHVLLTFAEASASSGNLNSKSFECVNSIRRRARNLDPASSSEFDLLSNLSAQDFIDSVMWERAWELAGEPEGRWFDLVRRQKVEDLVNLRYDDEGGVPEYPLSEQDYYTPIPSSDQLLNPFLNN